MKLQFDFANGIVIGVRGSPVGSVKRHGYIEVFDAGKRHLAHRLLWEAANGPIPKGMQINHKNGVKTDNRLSNMELVTPSQNIQHAHDTGLAKSLQGERRREAKLSDEAVREIRASGERQRVLANKYGVHQSIISEVKNRKRWAHVADRGF